MEPQHQELLEESVLCKNSQYTMIVLIEGELLTVTVTASSGCVRSTSRIIPSSLTDQI